MYYNQKGEEVSMEEWVSSFEEFGSRIVKQETSGSFWISTVFLGLDHRFGGDGPPLIFETMVFSKDRDEEDMERYTTLEEAEAGHKKMVEKYK